MPTYAQMEQTPLEEGDSVCVFCQSAGVSGSWVSAVVIEKHEDSARIRVGFRIGNKYCEKNVHTSSSNLRTEDTRRGKAVNLHMDAALLQSALPQSRMPPLRELVDEDGCFKIDGRNMGNNWKPSVAQLVETSDEEGDYSELSECDPETFFELQFQTQEKSSKRSSHRSRTARRDQSGLKQHDEIMGENRGSWEMFALKHDRRKDARQLKFVLDQTVETFGKLVDMAALQSRETLFAVTSFRKGGCNANHSHMHQLDRILRETLGCAYVHYQSGFENSLFGWTADGGRAGRRNVATPQKMATYKQLNLRDYWYIEWLFVMDLCVQSGGYLVVYDLSGEAAMRSSANCQMELALLYQMAQLAQSKMKLIVLHDEDVKEGVDLALVIQKKKEDEDGQKRLFQQAYENGCAIPEFGHECVLKWLSDFGDAGGDVSRWNEAIFTMCEGGMLEKVLRNLIAKDPSNANWQHGMALMELIRESQQSARPLPLAMSD